MISQQEIESLSDQYFAALAHANGADYRAKHGMDGMVYTSGRFRVVYNGRPGRSSWHGAKQMRETIAVLLARPKHVNA